MIWSSLLPSYNNVEELLPEMRHWWRKASRSGGLGLWFRSTTTMMRWWRGAAYAFGFDAQMAALYNGFWLTRHGNARSLALCNHNECRPTVHCFNFQSQPRMQKSNKSTNNLFLLYLCCVIGYSFPFYFK